VKHELADGNGAAWLTKAEALSMLGKSDRSLDRLVAARKVQRTTRPRDGRTPEPLYNRADLERLTAVDAFPIAEEGGKQLTARRDAPPLPHPAQLAALVDFASAMRSLTAPSQAEASAIAMAWLTIDSASAHSGLSATLLRRLISAGELPALRDGRRWKIRREDLDAIRAPAKSDRANRAASPPVARPACEGGDT